MKKSTTSTLKVLGGGLALGAVGLVTLLSLIFLAGVVFTSLVESAGGYVKFTNTTDHDQKATIIYHNWDDGDYYATTHTVKPYATLKKSSPLFGSLACLSVDNSGYRYLDLGYDGNANTVKNLFISSATIENLKPCDAYIFDDLSDAMLRTWYWDKDPQAFLTFQDGLKFSGSTGCNSISGSYFLGTTDILIKDAVHTERGCDPTNEPEFLSDFFQINTYTYTDDELVFTLNDGGTMRFTSEE